MRARSRDRTGAPATRSADCSSLYCDTPCRCARPGAPRASRYRPRRRGDRACRTGCSWHIRRWVAPARGPGASRCPASADARSPARRPSTRRAPPSGAGSPRATPGSRGTITIPVRTGTFPRAARMPFQRRGSPGDPRGRSPPSGRGRTSWTRHRPPRPTGRVPGASERRCGPPRGGGAGPPPPLSGSRARNGCRRERSWSPMMTFQDPIH